MRTIDNAMDSCTKYNLLKSELDLSAEIGIWRIDSIWIEADGRGPAPEWTEVTHLRLLRS
jgi:hypothetical protein